MNTERTFPKIDFTTFLLSISSAAYMGMGVISRDGKPIQKPGDTEVDLELARQNIDLLELMLEKTKGNRSSEEDRLLDQLLFETRMLFVETQKRITEHAKK